MKSFCIFDQWSGLSYLFWNKAFLLLIALYDGTVTATAKKKHRFLGGADAMVCYSIIIARLLVLPYCVSFKRISRPFFHLPPASLRADSAHRCSV